MVLNPITNRHRSLFTHRSSRRYSRSASCIPCGRRLRKPGVHDYPIHIKIDTGMHRVGFLENDIEILAKVLSGQSELRVASVFTHLATADCPDLSDYTEAQISAYHRCADKLESLLGYKIKRHYLNTAGMMDYADSGEYDMARLGIGLYGISPFGEIDCNLHPVASLHTRIISLKHWPAALL